MAEAADRPLLLGLFSALKDLYYHVEAHSLVELGAEVVEALSMCQHDFIQLVRRLHDDAPRDGAPPALAAACGSPLAQRLAVPGVEDELDRENGDGPAVRDATPTSQYSLHVSPEASRHGSPFGSQPGSPIAQLSSPEVNSRMLDQLSALDMEQLQEAAHYFSLAEPIGGLLPRKQHEVRYMELAVSGGREMAARRFLVTLEQMTRRACRVVETVAVEPNSADARAGDSVQWAVQPDCEVLPFSPPEHVSLLSARGGTQRGGMLETPPVDADGGWELAKNRRASRRRQLWPAEARFAESGDGGGQRSMSHVAASVEHTDEGILPPERGPMEARGREANGPGLGSAELGGTKAEGIEEAVVAPRLKAQVVVQGGDASGGLEAGIISEGPKRAALETAVCGKTVPGVAVPCAPASSLATAAGVMAASGAATSSGSAAGTGVAAPGAAVPVGSGCLSPEVSGVADSEDTTPSISGEPSSCEVMWQTRCSTNAPLPAWTSWGEEEGATTVEVRRRKKKPPLPSFLPSSMHSPPSKRVEGDDEGGSAADGEDCVSKVGGADSEADAPGDAPSASRPSSAAKDSPTLGRMRAAVEGGARREKLLSPGRRTAEELHEITRRRHERAEATRELRAAEEASRLERRRYREAQVRERNAQLSLEKKRALEEKMLRAEAAREANVTSKASRARLENQKVEEVAFINSINGIHCTSPLEKRKDAITQRMEEAAARREMQYERMVTANAARGSAASERHRQLLLRYGEKLRSAGSRANEAYMRWIESTRSVSQRAAEKNARHRSEVLERREVQQRAAELEVESKKAALQQRMAEANARRLAHIELLLQQARITSERQAAVQQAREMRRISGGGDLERGEGEGDGSDEASSRRKGSRGQTIRRRHWDRGGRSVLYTDAGDDGRSESTRSNRSTASETPPNDAGDARNQLLTALRHDELSSEGYELPGITPGLVFAAAPTGEPSEDARSNVSPLRELHERVLASEAALQEAERERLRRLRTKAKKARQRMATTAAGIRVEQLEQLWTATTFMGLPAAPAAPSARRLIRLLHDLAQLAQQPSSDGAEASVVEVCKLLEAGRERELHAVRTHGGIEHLLTLAAAGVPTDGSAGATRRTTQTGALRALLAACALPCNRAYLLLRNHMDKLAFQLLPSVVTSEIQASRSIETSLPPDAPLLPLLKLLRLVIATPPPLEAAHKLRSDLVMTLRFSGGLEALQRYCASCSSTLQLASQHEALLLQYIALLHALLLPVRADPDCSCAGPLKAFLDQSGLAGVPGLVCAVLYESSRMLRQRSAAPSDAALVHLPALRLCRAAVQLLIHIGSIPFGKAAGGAPPSFLASALGGGELKVQTFHLAHLALHMCELVDPDGACVPDAAPTHDSQQVSTASLGSAGLLRPGVPHALCSEMRSFAHEVILLIGLFCLGSRTNCEVLRWRWGQHPTMLDRLVGSRFSYFVGPLRDVLLPTLVCACLHDSINLRVLATKLAPAHLVCYLERAIRSPPSPTATNANPAAILLPDPSELPMVSLDYSLAARLPTHLWEEALAFLSQLPDLASIDSDLHEAAEDERSGDAMTPAADPFAFPPPLAALCTG